MPLSTSDSLYRPFNPPSPLAPLSDGEHDERVVVLAGALERGDHAADLLVGLRHHAGEDFHLAGVELLLLGVQAVPFGNLRDAVGELGAGGKKLHRHLLRENRFAGLVPAHVELALVHVDVLLLDLMRRVHGAGRPEQEERPVGIDRGVRGDVVDRPVGQIGGQVIVRLAHPGLRRTMIVPKQRAVIVRVGRHEAIEMVEALAAGPMVKRAALRSFRQRRVIPFAEREGFKARVLEMLGDGFRALGRSAVVAGEAHRRERVGAQADLVRIPARHQRRPRRRAQRRACESCCSASHRRPAHRCSASGSGRRSSRIGRKPTSSSRMMSTLGVPGFGFVVFGIPLHGFLVGSPDLAFEHLAIFLEGRRRRPARMPP